MSDNLRIQAEEAYPRVISLDIETFGAVEGPDQTTFHPQRSIATDRIPVKDLIRTVSITLPERDPRCLFGNMESQTTPLTNSANSLPVSGITSPSTHFWTGSLLSRLRPGPSMVLVMARPEHRVILSRWLRWTDTLLGHNIQYDLLYLRTVPEFRTLLAGRHTLIDGMVLNALHNENRPEKSLKDIGPVRRLFRYDRETTLKDGRRFKGDWDEALHYYNACDSHNTMLEVADFATAILRDWPETAKLSPYCIQFYNDALWFAIRLSEAGIPVNREKLRGLHDSCQEKAAHAFKVLKEKHGLVIGGKGSNESRRVFITKAIEKLDNAGVPQTLGLTSVLDHHLIQLTKARKEVSLGDQNRALITLLLKGLPCSTTDTPPTSSSPSLVSSSAPSSPDGSGSSCLEPVERSLDITSKNSTGQLVEAFSLWDEFQDATKLISSYTCPLLDKRRGGNVKNPYDSILLPQSEAPLWTRPGTPSSSLAPPPSLPLSSSPSVSSARTSTTPPTRSTEPCQPSAVEYSLFGPMEPGPTPSSPSKSPAKGRRKRGSLLVLRTSASNSPTTEPSTSEIGAVRITRPPSVGLLPLQHKWNTFLAYPTVYVVPGPTKDTSPDSGGQRQSRFSIKNPARQTWPREVYSCEASRWGDEGVICSMDLSQIELRVPAVFSGEPTLIDAYNNKWDLHGRTAVSLFGEEAILQKYPALVGKPVDKWKNYDDNYDKNERLLGKTVNFASGYWAGARRMQATALSDMGLLLPISFFRRVVDIRPQLRPRLYAWQESHLWEVSRLGYSVVPFVGQSRYFEGYDYSRRLNGTNRDDEFGKDQTSEVLNHPVQTTAANVLHRIAARLGSTLPSLGHCAPEIFCYANVYDALYFDCKRTLLEDLKAMIAEAVKYVEQHEYWAMLANYYGNFVPLSYDITIKSN